ncbi:MAG TPA: Arm DNA-binding domain-containing protein [Mucilaginibacter sp.]|nr:Arm DNA-binding domain-containing protein [Mucilaginibacter sp.]
MKAMNTFGVQFILRKDKLKAGKAPIYARITVNGEIIHFAVKQWDIPQISLRANHKALCSSDHQSRLGSKVLPAVR